MDFIVDLSQCLERYHDLLDLDKLSQEISNWFEMEQSISWLINQFKMAKLLFPDFLDQVEIYEAAEALWRAHFDALAEKHQFAYAPYLNVVISTGHNGNPIFNAEVKNLNRGVRIIQEAPEKPEDYFISAWLDTFPIDELNPLNELVIALVLSEETIKIVERLIGYWLVEQRSKEEMEEILVGDLGLLEWSQNQQLF